uniref:Uncharacterized protein n=1 Tax=Anguilla anguilla TaxID=7936 RepID=A0A0E9QTU4_ANGAN
MVSAWLLTIFLKRSTSNSELLHTPYHFFCRDEMVFTGNISVFGWYGLCAHIGDPRALLFWY